MIAGQFYRWTFAHFVQVPRVWLSFNFALLLLQNCDPLGVDPA